MRRAWEERAAQREAEDERRRKEGKMTGSSLAALLMATMLAGTCRRDD